jgi:acyl-CoA oxidase
MYGADPKKVNKKEKFPYRVGSIKRNIVASDLVEERAHCNFDQDELCRFIDPLVENKKEFMTLVEKTPQLSNTHKFYEMTIAEKQENLWSRLHHLYTHSPELRRKHFDDYDPVAAPFWHWPFYIQGTIPGGMHVLMGYTAMATLANDKQNEYWLPKFRRWEVIACYAQTELGHGSNIAGLETTATFDQEKNEIVINSPTPTSTKWWPGDMSRFCNYAIVYAKLILNGQQAGVQPFLVQLRSNDDFSVMPGVKLGDMGPKFGYQSKDNGWLQFDNVRIPKD